MKFRGKEKKKLFPFQLQKLLTLLFYENRRLTWLLRSPIPVLFSSFSVLDLKREKRLLI